MKCSNFLKHVKMFNVQCAEDKKSYVPGFLTNAREFFLDFLFFKTI